MPVQAVNSIQTTDPGLKFTAGNQTWVIAPGVIVSSDQSDGVDGTVDDGLSLINYGNVLAASEAGAFFNTDQIAVFNQAGGLISGPIGILSIGNHVFIRNHGVIDSTSQGVLFGEGSDLSLTNTGAIHGVVSGVDFEAGFDGSGILNSGVIEAEQIGVVVNIGTGLITSIVNSGKIAGRMAAVQVRDGAINLVNNGDIAGDIDCLATGEMDVVANFGAIDGLIGLGSGDDVYDGEGGTITGNVFGEVGNDLLMGGVEIDRLFGDAGNDNLRGGLANDILWGGAGDDEFVFNTTPNRTTNRDDLPDFNPSDDLIMLDRDVYKGLGKVGTLKKKYFEIGSGPDDKNDRVVYNDQNGLLKWAAKGDQGKVVTFAKLDSGLDMSNKDFVLF